VNAPTKLTENIKLRIDALTQSELERIARNEDRSVAAVIRRSIRFYLDAKRKGLV
jgi:predicted transcriptional regulator